MQTTQESNQPKKAHIQKVREQIYTNQSTIMFLFNMSEEDYMFMVVDRGLAYLKKMDETYPGLYLALYNKKIYWNWFRIEHGKAETWYITKEVHERPAANWKSYSRILHFYCMDSANIKHSFTTFVNNVEKYTAQMPII